MLVKVQETKADTTRLPISSGGELSGRPLFPEPKTSRLGRPYRSNWAHSLNKWGGWGSEQRLGHSGLDSIHQHTKYEDFTALWTIFTQTKGTFKSPKGFCQFQIKGPLEWQLHLRWKFQVKFAEYKRCKSVGVPPCLLTSQAGTGYTLAQGISGYRGVRSNWP
jgi:hypothetical protein